MTLLWFSVVFYNKDFQECVRKLTANISNSLTDRCASNHAAIRLVNSAWNKTITELNCHLHPLDSVATNVRSALKSLQTEKGSLWGSDCLAANVILSMNKVRYKDGKGDPMRFKNHLIKHKLGKGFIPRYRGNRLHVLFHIAGKYFVHHTKFVEFLQKGTPLGGLKPSLLKDFRNPQTKLQLQVLGLIGKLFSGPWMKLFYTSSTSEINHMEGILVVKRVVQSVTDQMKNPGGILSRDTDFFGNQVNQGLDQVLSALRVEPLDLQAFAKYVEACLGAVVAVLKRQYERYFNVDITNELKKQTQSARSHNIDAEEVMGMFSAAKAKAQNATLCFLSSKIRGQKNKVVEYLDSLPLEKRERVVKFAISYARKQRARNRKKQKKVMEEIRKRDTLRTEKRNMVDLKKLEKKLEAIQPLTESGLEEEFPDMDAGMLEETMDILQGKVVGRNICHYWFDTETQEKTLYYGRVEKLRKNRLTYRVCYWNDGETFDDGESYDLSKYSLAVDLQSSDLTLC